MGKLTEDAGEVDTTFATFWSVYKINLQLLQILKNFYTFFKIEVISNRWETTHAVQCQQSTKPVFFPKVGLFVGPQEKFDFCFPLLLGVKPSQAPELGKFHRS